MYNSWWCQIGTTNLLYYVKEEDYEIFKAVFTYSMYHICWRTCQICSAAANSGKYLRYGDFIPAGVGLMVSWNVLKPLLIPVGIITFVSFVAVAVATGKTSQWMLKKDEGKDHE